MEKTAFIELISNHIKLVRTEQQMTQDKMCEVLGISKKSLVQIEKGRTQANWTTVVTFCLVFNHSKLLFSLIGDQPADFVRLLAFKYNGSPKDQTLGGRVWWKEIE